MSKGLRTDILTLLGLGAAAAAGIAALILRSLGGGSDPLSAVPADSFLIVTVDVAAVAQSPLGEALIGQLKDQAAAKADALLGVDSITATCGFDPLPQLRSIAVAVPEETNGDAERGDFGIAASGPLSKDALARCVSAVIAKRGGEVATRQAGTFTIVSDAKAQSGAEIAYREGGPYLVGRGAWLLRMIDAADGRTPSTLSAKPNAHADLRADLAKQDADAEAVRATALLPRPIRERLEGELAREAKGNKAMEGVLGVSSAAVGVHAGRAHEDARFAAELRCDTASACDAVSTFILHTRLLASGNLGYRLFGLGSLIDNLQVHADPSRTLLYIGTRAPADDLAAILDRTLRSAPKKPRPNEIGGAGQAPRAAPDAGF